MTDKLQIKNVSQTQTDATPAVDTESSKRSLLHDVVMQIRSDCGKQSQQYLDETNVPHGGE